MRLEQAVILDGLKAGDRCIDGAKLNKRDASDAGRFKLWSSTELKKVESTATAPFYGP